jgi:hypothetical protein
MRRGGAAALLVTAALGLVALAVEAAGDKRDLAFTLGVVPSTPAVRLAPERMVCQGPIVVSEEFDRIGLKAGSPGAPGSPLTISVVTLAGNPIASGRIQGGYAYPTEQSAEVGRVAAGRRVSVCVHNDGTERVDVYGNAGVAALTSQALLNGRRPLDTDLTLVFLHDERRSMLSQLSDVFQRASVFRPGWVGAWTFWVLTAAVLIGVPLLLARALSESETAPQERP